jgi:hypothetical protein
MNQPLRRRGLPAYNLKFASRVRSSKLYQAILTVPTRPIRYFSPNPLTSVLTSIEMTHTKSSLQLLVPFPMCASRGPRSIAFFRRSISFHQRNKVMGKTDGTSGFFPLNTSRNKCRKELMVVWSPMLLSKKEEEKFGNSVLCFPWIPHQLDEVLQSGWDQWIPLIQ